MKHIIESFSKLSALGLHQRRFVTTRITSQENAAIIAKEILTEFQEHRANRHELFDFLKKVSQGPGLTAAQYLVYRSNFFFRTARTIYSAAMHIVKAVDNHDYETVASSTKNVKDEGGDGKVEEVHLKLLEDSHNKHGKTIYGLPPITIVGTKNDPSVIDEARKFRRMQEEVFRSSYQTMTGCLLAHEDAADQMLVNFRKYIFEPHRGYYTREEFKDLMRYYDAHKDDSREGGDIEEQHRDEALRASVRIISSDARAAHLIRRGGLKFLEAQAELWDGLMKEMEQQKFHGQPVAPKLEFLTESPRTSVATKSSAIHQLVSTSKLPTIS